MSFVRGLRTTTVVLAIFIATAGSSFAQVKSVCLIAGEFDKTLQNGATVTMWGFGEADCSTWDVVSVPSVPGPTISVAPTEVTLQIQLRNDLPLGTGGERRDVSVVIPGLALPLTTGPEDDGNGRTTSFVESAVVAATTTYIWDNVESGTYLYHSGTHPAVQVQMGLYGAVTKDAAAGQAYSGYSNTNEVILIYSEIDPALHDAVVNGQYGPSGTMTSTMNYRPRYFLVNGEPFPSTVPQQLTTGEATVIRFLNAGLQTHVPTFEGLWMNVIAEDGNLYPYSKPQYSVRLPAGKTLDALVVPTAAGTVPLYDRMMGLTNDGAPHGGMLVYLDVIAGTEGGPVADDDSYTVNEDTGLTILAADGVLVGDTGTGIEAVLGSPTSAGTLSLSADGSFTYTPDPNFFGTDNFTYRARDSGGAESNLATVVITVNGVNDSPVATDDEYAATSLGGGPFSIPAPGVLVNDSDPDRDTLTVEVSGMATGGMVALAEDGSFTFTPATNATIQGSFSYIIRENGVASAAVGNVNINIEAAETTPPAPAKTVTLNVVGPDGPVTDFRWIVEEDATFKPTPGIQQPDPNDVLALSFHKSYMPVVGEGEGASVPLLDANKNYHVSVLPNSGYSIGGASIPAAVLDGSMVDVFVQKQPIPTAQITVLVFEDNYSINNAPDLPEETGLEGFQVVVIDAAGRYGAPGGQMMMDAFGNLLGTTYQRDANGIPLVDANGDPVVTQAGSGVIRTDAEGRVTIKNLAPGKYGIQVVPPEGQGWSQTTTIEGGKTIDAWVKADEPGFFTEFGPPGTHVFIGFVKAFEDTAALNGTTSLSGRVTNLHMSRPPETQFFSGAPLEHTTAWIGLNIEGRGVYAQRANSDPGGSNHNRFTINNVPPGTHQLVIWDDFKDTIIAFKNVTVNPDGSCTPECELGDVPVFTWFSRMEHHVFHDVDEDGVRDAGEEPIIEQAVNLRFRDGTIYQSFPTDGEGFVPFDEVFPFFSWQVMEVDYARFKATGATFQVDAGGGPVDVLVPQEQFDGTTSRTEGEGTLTQAFQGFIGQTSIVEWGKRPWGANENGGIAGIVHYATTRAEDNPRLAAAEEWEPGIPRVEVILYQDADADKKADDLDRDGRVTVPDVDNHPLGNFPGAEDVDRNINGVFDYGDAVQIVWTDSWDDSQPADCPGGGPKGGPLDITDPFYNDGRCYDGLRNFNQVRPGVFDGGYAFLSYYPGGMANNLDGSGMLNVAAEAVLPAGSYIAQAVPPPGYKLVREQDRNVDFGDGFIPASEAVAALAAAQLGLPSQATAEHWGITQPECVGALHKVPLELSLFPGTPASFAGELRPQCDMKAVHLSNGLNGVADFFFFTETPIASHIVGFILDDSAVEFNRNSPQFGEKYAPPWLPVSVRDWTGKEISRVYSDEWGRFNVLVPSTYTMNLPIPSGVSPNMLITCMNDPVLPDGTPDLQYNPQYSTFCYTLQYMPGTTTYLDTPVIPVAAFAGSSQYPLDCALPDGTPKIDRVTSSEPGGGPYVSVADGSKTLTIFSEETVQVPNPAYDGPGGSLPKQISRKYGFGDAAGEVTVEGFPLEIMSWSDSTITATVPEGTPTGQLMVTKADGTSTVSGVTVTVGPINGTVHHVMSGGSIQQAIDGAAPGDLILVAPGLYEEMVIMWKPVHLQGWGPGSTTISAVNVPGNKLEDWRRDVALHVSNGDVNLLPAQENGFGGIEPDALFTEEGAAIIVLAKDANPNQGGFTPGKARIDGFNITGAATGGGIVVNGYARGLRIGNNWIHGNQGVFGGGIRIGHPELVLVNADGQAEYQNAFNDQIRIHHNQITQNGGLGGAGGGVSLCTGSEGYRVTDNWICGNFSTRDGGGIGHLGLSDGGRIERNKILFNQTFNQGLPDVSGGGIFIAGQAPLGATGRAALSPGAGTVSVTENLIQGNHAGSGDGGGVRTFRVNGQDVWDRPRNRGQWHRIDLVNNMIANNVAAMAGGGISLKDTARINILHNTIAHNDSTATAGVAFASPNQSTPQPAGIVSYAHSQLLAETFGSNQQDLSVFSNPLFQNNIVWQNRSLHFDLAAGFPDYLQTRDTVPGAGTSPYWDLQVLGAGPMDQLNPTDSILTDTTGYDSSNSSTDPSFVAEYVNFAPSSIVPGEPTTIQAAPALDEGGNFVQVRFGPLSLYNDFGTEGDGEPGMLFGDCHIASGSPAIDSAAPAGVGIDIDGQARPSGAGPDIGADESVAQGGQ